MMATEATSENFATTSSIPNHELNITETQSQDATPDHPVVPVLNGNIEKDEIKQDAEHIESAVHSGEASVSGGSDTEASKTETSKIAADGKGHVRTTSTVKKFASFKPVSVNKTFLAAKGATPVAPSKLGDKGATALSAAQPGPSTSATPRPRLVAKSGNGLRDSAPRTSAAANGGKPGAAPDASAVWNKNRPAPPPEPKRYTDEELQKQYGIHLATRIHSEDQVNQGGKQANWADIDDDDEDWAPQSMEWSDGTKITLPQADDAPAAPAPEPVPSPALNEIRAPEIAKPKSPAPPLSSASPTVKSSGFGSGRAGLVLKGASEKPTLVAKPPGPPTPVKSPWASLPPVDKVAPVPVDIPQNQQPQSRFSQRDPHGFNGMPPPAKEIAADDFSRSTWRGDSGSNAGRELYDSKSGRYEPVNENRRGSTRHDARHPALLQRSSHGDGPAEPSAAFQTHRAGGQDGGYGRRRTSSNVSGGSGNFARRMSRGHDMPPHDMLSVRRGSLAAVSDASSPRNFSPSGQYQSQRGHQNQQWPSHASPAFSHPSPHSAHSQPIPPATIAENQGQPALPYEDPVEQQKKIMKQTRELAIKRRQEEEAKEEAARKERIRLKLEAMGPAPESKKNKKDNPKEEKSIPTQIQTRDSADAAAAQSKPVSETPTDSNVEKFEQIATMSAHDVKSHDKLSPNEDQRLNGIHPTSSSSQPTRLPQDSSTPQSWQNNSSSTSDRFHPWAPAPTQQSSRNVWGPPTNDRTLGNGTFDPELSRLPEMQQSSNPGPIGPPNRGNGQFQQGRGREQYGARPAPIGPPARQPQPSASRQQQQERAAVANSGWGNAAQRIAQEDRTLREEQDKAIAERRNLEEQGIAPEIAQPAINDTWRQVALNEDGTRSKITGRHTVVHDPTQSAAPKEEATTIPMFDEQGPARLNFDSVGNQSQLNDTWKSPSNMNTSAPIRGSRFFPNNRDVRLEEQNSSFDRPGSPSPPPPTMAGHPAYDGDSAHPHVSLPRPSPVVKLPPAVLAPIGPPKPTSFAAAVTAPVVAQIKPNAYQGRQEFSTRNPPSYQDIRRQEPTAGGWQDRINSLIGRKNSPPKSHALAVDSSSKNALELPISQSTATVSLPSSVTGDLSVDDGSVVTKPAAEECFEEQEMGSLPVIKVPSSAPALAWNLAPQPKPIHRKLALSQITSVLNIQFFPQFANNSNIIAIKVPGQDTVINVNVPIPRQSSNPRRGGSRGGSRNSSSSHPRGGRGRRDTSSGFPSPNLDNASVSSSLNSGRGGRAYGGNWNRHVSTPVHT